MWVEKQSQNRGIMESWLAKSSEILQSNPSPARPRPPLTHVPGALSVWVLNTCRNGGDPNTSLSCAGVRKWPWQHSMDLESARDCRDCRDWGVKAVGVQRD